MIPVSKFLPKRSCKWECNPTFDQDTIPGFLTSFWDEFLWLEAKKLLGKEIEVAFATTST